MQEREREREKAPEIVFFVVVFFTKKNRQRKETNNKNNRDDKKKEKQKLKRGRPIKSNQGGSLGDDFTREKKHDFYFSFLFIYLFIFLVAVFFLFFSIFNNERTAIKQCERCLQRRNGGQKKINQDK